MVRRVPEQAKIHLTCRAASGEREPNVEKQRRITKEDDGTPKLR